MPHNPEHERPSPADVLFSVLDPLGSLFEQKIAPALGMSEGEALLASFLVPGIPLGKLGKSGKLLSRLTEQFNAIGRGGGDAFADPLKLAAQAQDSQGLADEARMLKEISLERAQNVPSGLATAVKQNTAGAHASELINSVAAGQFRQRALSRVADDKHLLHALLEAEDPDMNRLLEFMDNHMDDLDAMNDLDSLLPSSTTMLNRATSIDEDLRVLDALTQTQDMLTQRSYAELVDLITRLDDETAEMLVQMFEGGF